MSVMIWKATRIGNLSLFIPVSGSFYIPAYTHIKKTTRAIDSNKNVEPLFIYLFICI